MMEFIISKLWTVICGIIVMSVILSLFSSLDLSSGCAIAARSASNVVEIMEETSRMGEGSFFRLQLDEIMPHGETELILYNDHLCVRVGESEEFAILEGARMSGALPLVCHHDDTILLQATGEGTLVVQLEEP